MSSARIQDFSHLLKALDAGCPPHAGLAIGFDRLIAVLCGTDSVRDVIAFPKNSKGDDVMVGSPREVGAEELGRYGLGVVPQMKVNEVEKLEEVKSKDGIDAEPEMSEEEKNKTKKEKRESEEEEREEKKGEEQKDEE